MQDLFHSLVNPFGGGLCLVPDTLRLPSRFLLNVVLERLGRDQGLLDGSLPPLLSFHAFRQQLDPLSQCEIQFYDRFEPLRDEIEKLVHLWWIVSSKPAGEVPLLLSDLQRCQVHYSGRSPKMAEPMRTIVLPSSTANS